VRSGDTLSLSVEKPAAGGRMIARADGQVVLVSGAIPGEQVLARVERVARGVAYAEVIAVEEPSADRREPAADPLCGGCLYSHIAYSRQLEVKAQVVEDAFARIGRLHLPNPLTVAGSPEDGYRMRARVRLRGGDVGFFREGTHEICPARPTRQLRADTCDVLDRLAGALRSRGVLGAQEIELSENLDASQRAVHLEDAAGISAAGMRSLHTLEGLTGLSVGSSGVPRSRIHVVFGDPHVVDRLEIEGHAVALRRHVLAFFQANRYLLPSLAAHVMQAIGAATRVVDLYAGTGLFSVAAALTRGARVTAVEGDRTAAVDLTENAASTGGLVRAVHAPVEEFVYGERRPDVLIVDPPRTGMSNAAIERTLALEGSTIVYVSCDVATLARDARKIVAAGYRLSGISAFDLFPNTPHVETVALFAR
jgi:23S rRNA (uracil1939-C5)-methyltransferase